MLRLCKACGDPLPDDAYRTRKNCESCSGSRNKRTYASRRADPAKWAATLGRQRDYYKQHLEKQHRRGKLYYSANREARSADGVRRRRMARALVIEMYGGKCDCCGESQFEFLAIDHINGGGRKDKAKYKNFTAYFKWLTSEKRSGYRVLCHNCNQALGSYGRCPHDDDRS